MEPVAKWQTYAGLFMVTLATLMYEIVLTRIFSVTMWYHYAFIAISVALFGLTVGALIVYLLPNIFSVERLKFQLGLSALFFAVSIIFSFLTHLSIPFATRFDSLVEVYSVVLLYVIISIPFVLSGVCVTLALTKFPGQVSKLYAVDLAGASLGCVLLIGVLQVTDGPTSVVFIAALAAIGATLFFSETKRRRPLYISAGAVALFLLFAGGHTALVYQQSPWLRLVWVKGRAEARPIHEAWNSFSRIRVSGNPDVPEYPFGWGLSPSYVSSKKVRQIHMNIDASAGTIMTAFDGDLDKLDYLKFDIVNLAHYLRLEADVMVVGAGGGRDILSALVFEQNSVVGVEINQDILKIVNQEFGDFTGHLDQYPQVTFVNDEARSYITRTDQNFDIIQISLIDSWAATAAGAFVLTENTLYTIDAWDIFLDRLTDDGILTVSRWYFRTLPGEMYRLTTLASESLRRAGVENPRAHIMIVRRMRGRESDQPDGIGTMLVNRSPFTQKDIDTINEIVKQGRLELVLTPEFSADPTYETLTSGEDLDHFFSTFPLDITPPTDDDPFFFHMLRLQDIFNSDAIYQGKNHFNIAAVGTLGVLLITVLGLTLLCIIVPLLLTTGKDSLKGSVSLFLYFAAIGFGFILVEISQMQRLAIFLGHPTYSLSVVLFTILLASGLGSYLSQRVHLGDSRNLMILLAVLIAFGVSTPVIIAISRGFTTPMRILIAALTLFPLGIFMGMPFPLGMRVASGRVAELTPWLWGINGATSVCGSVLVVVIGLATTISTSYWIGFISYIVAAVAFYRARRQTS